MQKGNEVNIVGTTKKIMVGITMTTLTLGLAGCDSDSGELPPQPNDSSCDDWDWENDEGVWECDDNNSNYYGYYFYAGQYYKNKNALIKSSDYSNYKNSSSFKGGGTTSSGFGSGSKTFGG